VQADAQLVRAVRIVALEHNLTVDENLPSYRGKNGHHGCGAGIFAPDADGPRLLRLDYHTFFAQGEAIATVRFAVGAQLQIMADQQLLGGQQKTLGITGVSPRWATDTINVKTPAD
jgi:hypothetical protein